MAEVDAGEQDITITHIDATNPAYTDINFAICNYVGRLRISGPNVPASLDALLGSPDSDCKFELIRPTWTGGISIRGPFDPDGFVISRIFRGENLFARYFTEYFVCCDKNGSVKSRNEVRSRIVGLTRRLRFRREYYARRVDCDQFDVAGPLADFGGLRALLDKLLERRGNVRVGDVITV